MDKSNEAIIQLLTDKNPLASVEQATHTPMTVREIFIKPYVKTLAK